MREEWLMPGAVVPVDAETTSALVAEIKRLIGVVGGMALGMQPAQQQEPVACRDEMCACRGGPCASCPDGEREKELADMRDSRDFYKRRTDELQKAQSQMRDPERTMVCDILANGRLLVPAAGRYNTSPPASASVSVERVEPVPAAMKTIIQAMQQDPEYAWGWHCNIAMAFVDAGGDHYTGNQGAARFMKLLANVEPAHELPSPQPSQRSVEPVANGLPLVIAGAIFDFAGYLTTRDTVIEVGSTANASPVADLVKDWATLRGLSLADAAVLSWQEWLTDVRANDTSKERVDEMQKQRHDTTPPQPASKPWVGLTDEMVVAAARMLSDRQAAECNVDCGDMWKMHGNDFIEDARAALEAAHGIKEDA